MTSDRDLSDSADSARNISRAQVDATGLRCPLPLLKAKQALNQLQSGETLRVTATDAGSVRDFHAFADLSGNRLISFVEADGVFEYLLQKQ
jgi:tRNA 2-thiouridine synthesizing protein A